MRQELGSNNFSETVTCVSPIEYTYDAALNDSNKSFTVPGNELWKLSFAHITLATTATVGNRQLVLEVLNTASTVVFSSAAGAVQAASLTYTYDFMQGITKETAFVANVLQVPVPFNLHLPAGYSLRIRDSAAIDAAADDLTVSFQVEKFTV